MFRNVIATALIAAAIVTIVTGYSARNGSHPSEIVTESTAATTSPVLVPTSPSVEATAQPTPTPSPSYPEAGSGSWTVAEGQSQVVGTAGELLRFQVAVEQDITGVDAADFGQTAISILGNARSWTAGEKWRFQRVGPDQEPDFTIYLTTPATRDSLCNDGYDRYTSCRNGNKVVINVARWLLGATAFDANLDTYRQYVISHEVGHLLGFSHELCPGEGQVAPIMQQQTLGLHGCTANPWPYLNGTLYSGQSGEYNDPIPG